MIERKTIGLEEADKIVDAIIAHTKQKNGLPLSIAVVDSRGDLIKFVRMNGASWNSVQMAQMKAYSSAKFRRETSAVVDWMTGMNTTLADWGDPRVTSVGGGVCIWAPGTSTGTPMGAVAVSGWPQPEIDEKYARVGVAALD